MSLSAFVWIMTFMNFDVDFRAPVYVVNLGMRNWL